MSERRRSITRATKVEAVRRVTELGELPGEVATALGVRTDQVRQWIKQVGVAATEGGLVAGKQALVSKEQDELKRLRRENERLRAERDFLKKAAAYFAKESPDDTP